ncbi:cationic trypsin-3-like [Belonocnema kinseyi]|uniref:cationic trypsin-3-like n=1 Tax=Belonocnema kinseyi TaxID=2817044 RepID=UPI00143D88E1|nr:cationic trypsin-3-like [Belonocnema kinseyi]
MKFIFMVLLFAINSLGFPSNFNDYGMKKRIRSMEKRIFLPEAPFVAVVERHPLFSIPEKDYCGATIITEEWFLSSAACFFTDKYHDPKNLTLENFAIVTGASELPSVTKTSRHHIQEVHLSTKDTDSVSEKAVLIKVQTPIEVDDATQKPIRIGMKKDKPKNAQLVNLYGFYLNEQEDQLTPLTATDMSIDSSCYQRFSDISKEDVFCSEDYKNGQGQSIRVLTGTSVVRNGKLVGLVSNMFYADSVTKYYIILNIVDVHNWISSTIFQTS